MYKNTYTTKQRNQNLFARTLIYSLLIITTSLICYFGNLPLITSFIKELEAKSYDLLFIARHNLNLNPIPPNNIVIVGIDSTSMKKVGVPWPWPRQFHGALVDGLKEGGAKSIAFDIIFDTISPLSLQTQDVKGGDVISESSFDEGKEDDAIFARSISNAGNVFLAGEANLINKSEFESALPIKPFLEAIDFDSSHLGNTNVIYDNDNFIRKAKLIFPEYQSNPALSASLSLRVAQKYLNTKAKILSDYSIYLGKKKLPYKFLINYYGPGKTIKTIPYWQALEYIYGNKSDTFKDKIVLVGRTNLKASIDPFNSVRAPDTFPTPYSALTPNFSGIEVQANIISNILNHNFIKTPSLLSNIMVLVMIALITVAIIFRFRSNLILSFYLCTALGIIHLLITIISFITFKTALPVTYPLYGIIAPIYFINFLDQYFFVDSARRKQAKIFRQLVPPEIAEEIERMDTETLALGGIKREVTILFADIKNFTTICSKENPETIVNLLNEFFTGMVRIIHKHNGLVDKFIGDAIMAMWGSPKTLTRQEQVILAASCALEMQAELKSLNIVAKELGFTEPLNIRIGINTDEVITGNIGSPERMQFSAIGDGVNVTSRLEAVNKVYKTDILMAESSAKELVNKGYLVREIDSVIVPGKDSPINIFELMSQQTNTEQLISTYTEGLIAYRNKDFTTASKLWEKCFMLDKNDTTSKIMHERCINLLNNGTNLETWKPIWIVENK